MSNIPTSRKAIFIAIGTLRDILKRNGIHGDSNSIKPVLSEQNMINFLNFCLKYIDKRTLQLDSMYNYAIFSKKIVLRQ